MTREGTRRSPVRMLMIRIIFRVVRVIVRMRVIVHQASVAMFVGMDHDSSASLAFRADGRVYLPDPSAFGTLGALAHFFSPFIPQATGVHDLDPESDSHLHDCPPLFLSIRSFYRKIRSGPTRRRVSKSWETWYSPESSSCPETSRNGMLQVFDRS
jgi:hypothetical protein